LLQLQHCAFIAENAYINLDRCRELMHASLHIMGRANARAMRADAKSAIGSLRHNRTIAGRQSEVESLRLRARAASDDRAIVMPTEAICVMVFLRNKSWPHPIFTLCERDGAVLGGHRWHPTTTSTALASRRKVLDCMKWAGTGVLWTIAGGVPTSMGIIDGGLADEPKGLTFVQISSIFAEGKTAACLYTDLRNPASNRSYAKIGFNPACCSWHYARPRVAG
jgi:hypothetical protein